MKTKDKKTEKELRTEYNFDYSKAIRGKYSKRILKEGANVVMLEPDVATAFPTAEAVNEALRLVIKLRNLPSEGRRGPSGSDSRR